MAWTQSDIDALKKAIASGALTVEMDGRRITYRSLAEMRSTLAEMEQEVNPAAITRPRGYVLAPDRE